MSNLTNDRGEQTQPKVSTREVIKALAQHTNVPYKQAADIAYALLHFLKYGSLSLDTRIVIRNFGTFYPSKVKGREYGKHVDASTFHPDRMKLSLTSPLIEVEKWKNTQLIQSSVIDALDAEQKLTSMDKSVCVRIAELVLSNKPYTTRNVTDRLEFLREWVYATGASPLIPAVEERLDPDDRTFYILKLRLRGKTRRVFLFEERPEQFYLSAIIGSKSDIIFLPTGWVMAHEILNTPSVQEEEEEVVGFDVHSYGKSAEEETMSMFQAYLAVKYG